jgi:uncharacterized metal-binding protein YceD (DUF177 family)
MIDLRPLFQSEVESINFDGKYEIPKEIITNDNLYKNNEINDLSEITISNSSITKEGDNYVINYDIEGKIKIRDSISLEYEWYHFSSKINEKLEDFVEKNENILDINQFLWQNIVLEVPLRFTTITDYSKYQGDGWKLVSEDDLVKNNNPFNTLLNEEDRSD